MIASKTGMQRRWSARPARRSPRVEGGDHRGVLRAGDVADDADEADRAEREQRQVERVVAAELDAGRFGR